MPRRLERVDRGVSGRRASPKQSQGTPRESQGRVPTPKPNSIDDLDATMEEEGSERLFEGVVFTIIRSDDLDEGQADSVSGAPQ